MESMTGFANTSIEKKEISVSVNLKSLNGRYLDIKTNLPVDLYLLEDELRKKIKSNIQRGTVEVSISYAKNKTNESIESMSPWIQNYKKLVKKYNLKDDLTLSKVLKQAQSSGVYKLDSGDEELVHKLFLKALVDLKSQRKREGNELKKILESEVKETKKNLESLKRVAKKNTVSLKKEWEKKLKQISLDLSQEKAPQDVAVFLEKSDITEEIKRLEVHLKEFLKLIKSKESTLGKKLDFYCQELYREANTVASKSKKVDQTRLSVNLKSSIEKLRQQVQNIQ